MGRPLAAGRARPAAPAALAGCHALEWAALAWRAAHAGIDGIVLPAAVAAALALWVAQPMRLR